jgi:hypothetical protein
MPFFSIVPENSQPNPTAAADSLSSAALAAEPQAVRPQPQVSRAMGARMMLSELLPRRLDNQYRGNRVALWLFGLVVALKSVQSLAIILSGYSTAKDADGIPLDSYTPAVAQTVVAVLAQGSLWRLFFCLLCVLVLVRYRSAVPLMFALLALNYLAAQLVLTFVPLLRVGAPVGPLVNLILFLVMLVGLGLSLLRGGGSVANESGTA